MELLTISIVILLVTIALFIIAYPLWQQSQIILTGPITTPGHTYAELEARYNAELAAIKDLMFDYEMGKVTHDDYNQLLSLSKSRAARIRQEMSLLTSKPDIHPELDTKIEQLITQTRRQSVANINGYGTMLQQIDQDIAQLKHSNGRTTACPHCQGRVMVGDGFCPACGHTINNGHSVHTDREADQACRECGSAVQATDAFCAACGQALDPLLQAPRLESITTV
jgi:DNA-directed RNA polymerase subunit RPC12/RpoP